MHVHIHNRDASGSRAHQTEQRSDCCAFPRAVWADEAIEFPLFDSQIQIDYSSFFAI